MDIKRKTWIVFGNRKRCRHADAILSMGFINWTMNRTNFRKGDIVYMFMSDERKIRFKLIVADLNCSRDDSRFWEGEAPKDITYVLAFKDEYDGHLLDESELMKHGFKGGKSLQHPSCNNKELIDYIDSIFDSIDE